MDNPIDLAAMVSVHTSTESTIQSAFGPKQTIELVLARITAGCLLSIAIDIRKLTEKLAP